MAIKQRKQVTGTTEQINAYAGVEGQLVWNKTTKRWVGMSGTAGTNYPMASEHHQHSIANVTDLQKVLDSKATKTELTEGLAGKANSVHTHTIADVTGLQEALNTASTQASNAIPKTGNRGAIAGYELSTEGTTVNSSSPDTQHTITGSVTVANGTANSTWTKVVTMAGGSVSLSGNYWTWSGGNAPELKFPGVLVCHWNGWLPKGIASFISGTS